MNNLGQQWEKISDVVHRTAADCRDRYRNHLQDREVRRVGEYPSFVLPFERVGSRRAVQARGLRKRRTN